MQLKNKKEKNKVASIINIKNLEGEREKKTNVWP